MKFGTAGPSTQTQFLGDYKAYDCSAVDITSSAEVYFWQEDTWGSDDYGGNAADVVGNWKGTDTNGKNLKTDDNVAYVDVKVGADTYDRVYVS